MRSIYVIYVYWIADIYTYICSYVWNIAYSGKNVLIRLLVLTSNLFTYIHINIYVRVYQVFDLLKKYVFSLTFLDNYKVYG